jgi:hypothetical protein
MKSSINHQNKIRITIAAIAASLTPTINRVKSARAAVLKLLGKIPEGTATYKTLCPRGAGSGPGSHTFEQQTEVGSRRFARRRQKFIKDLSHTEWGRQFN